MKKHTPGPWFVKRDGLTITEGLRSDSDNFFPFEIAKVADGSNTDRANALLIAAAPELLAALKAVLTMEINGHQLQDRLQFSTAGREILEKSRAAIAKATGDAAMK